MYISPEVLEFIAGFLIGTVLFWSGKELIQWMWRIIKGIDK